MNERITEEIFWEKMTENLPNLMTDTNYRSISEKNKLNKYPQIKHTWIYHIENAKNKRKRENLKGQPERKRHIIHRGIRIRITADFSS